MLAFLPAIQIYIENQPQHVGKNNLVYASEDIYPYLTDIWAVLYFFMPMALITALYLLIWLKLKNRSNKKLKASQADRADTRTLTMFGEL